MTIETIGKLISASSRPVAGAEVANVVVCANKKNVLYVNVCINKLQVRSER